MVGDAQADVRIAGVEVLQAGEQHQTKCRLTRTDCDKAALKRPLKSQLLLNRAELFVGNGHTLIHLFALRCQCDTLVGTDKKFAAKLTFQIVHAPCDVGLVVFQNFRGFCKAVILCYEVKNAIIIICNHKNLRRMKKKKSSMMLQYKIHAPGCQGISEDGRPDCAGDGRREVEIFLKKHLQNTRTGYIV